MERERRIGRERVERERERVGGYIESEREGKKQRREREEEK